MTAYDKNQGSEDTRYSFLAGKIRARENKFLSFRDLENLFLSSGEEDGFNILTHAGYQLSPGAAAGSGSDRFLNENLALFYKEIEGLSYHPEINSLFAARYDFRNFSVLIKFGLSGKKIDRNFLTPVGLRKTEELITSFGQRDYGRYPEKIKGIFRDLQEKGEKEGMSRLNEEIDSAYFSWAAAEAEIHPFCSYLFKTMIDLGNIKNIKRAKGFTSGGNQLRFFIGGGRIVLADFKDCLEGRLSLERLAARYGHGKLSFCVKEGTDELIVDKGIDDYLMAIARETRFSGIGPEILCGYILAVETEMKNIRMIMRAKLSGLDKEEVFPYLREQYV